MKMDLSLISKSDNTPPPNPLSYAPNKHHSLPLLYHAPGPLYKECLRNHAAALGRHSLDGCGEFSAAASTPLTCAACGCHRNFHRREDPSPLTCAVSDPSPLTCAGKGGELINFSVATPPRERKRFRTRFSKEQKDEMLAFAERLGWKIRRSDDVAIEGFCYKVGISRGVLKVWMHNNKNIFATTKKDATINLAKNGSNLSVCSADGVSNNGVSANGDGSLSSA